VFHVFRKGFENGALELVYPFIATPDSINTVSLGLVDLAQSNLYIAFLAGGAQFVQARMMSTKKPAVQSKGAQDENMMAAMNKQMLYFMPVLTVIIGSTLPGGLTLYWLAVTLFTIAQQWIMFYFKKDPQLPSASGATEA
jgi:YidC/Oxa1 family membrane protein insertase